ncbi:MAG: sulfite exporter TauE/SafE family protein [Eubacterium sp.]
MYIIIYSIIIFAATFLGAFVGLGGGVIIKPLLDLIGHDTIDVVNFISCCAVFSMSISSTVKHTIAKTKINYKLIITISIGAVIGGICGSSLFDFLLNRFNNELLKGIQGIALGILLVFSVIYINIKNAKSFKVKHPAGIVAVGFALGAIASFLGVGGGPVNVAFLVLFLSMTMKEAAVYSVGIIFFSQLSKLITMAVNTSIPQVSPVTICAAIACAVIGGILGAKANRKGNEKSLKSVFTIVVAAIAIVNFYNGISGII